MSQFKSRAEAEKYRYGCWGGNPNGEAYDPKCCAERVCGSGRGDMPHQCTKKPGFGPDGIFCKQHDPEYVAKKDAERNAKDNARWKAERPNMYGKQLFALLKESQAGITLEWEKKRDQLIKQIEE